MYDDGDLHPIVSSCAHMQHVEMVSNHPNPNPGIMERVRATAGVCSA
jgi:hypothetical protein